MEDESKSKIVKHFLRFLKNHNVYWQYKEYFQQTQLCSFKKFVLNTTPYYYITVAFYWGETLEGSDFWTDIDKKWLKSYKDYE